MSDEKEFLHELINKATVALGRLERIERKKDVLSPEEILEMCDKARVAIDEQLVLISDRKKQLQ